MNKRIKPQQSARAVFTTLMLLAVSPSVHGVSFIGLAAGCASGINSNASVDSADTAFTGRCAEADAVDAVQVNGAIANMDYLMYDRGCSYDAPCPIKLNVDLIEGASYVGGRFYSVTEDVVDISTNATFSTLFILSGYVDENGTEIDLDLDPTGSGEYGYRIGPISLDVSGDTNYFTTTMKPVRQDDPMIDDPNEPIDGSQGLCVRVLATVGVAFDVSEPGGSGSEE